mgnify:FL=1
MTEATQPHGAPRRGEDLRIDVPGLTLAGRRWGDPAGRPFIALHGWLDNANTWTRLAPLLPELDIVALDFAGHGHSDHRAAGVHYVPLADIQDVIAAADALGFERFGLLGHSMGGAIASEIAGLFPERVTEAVFVDGLVHHEGNAATGNDRNRAAIEQMLRAHEKKPPVYADLEAMARRVTEATDQSLDAASELVGRGHAFVEGGCTWRTDPRIRFATPLRITARQIDDLMSRVTARCLLLVARDGDRWYRSGVERRAEHHPRLEIRELDGPHHLHLEPAHCEAVGREVRDFLAL